MEEETNHKGASWAGKSLAFMLSVMESPQSVFNQAVMSNLYFEKTILLSPLRTGCREENRREYKERSLEAPADITKRKCKAENMMKSKMAQDVLYKQN